MKTQKKIYFSFLTTGNWGRTTVMETGVAH
jgi:hypothetical protein